MINKAVGLRLKELREARKLSQERFANILGLGRTYIAELETGKRNISVRNLYRIVRGLGMTMAEFFTSEVFEEKPDSQETSIIIYYVTKF